jgi:hypothetical protein
MSAEHAEDAEQREHAEHAEHGRETDAARDRPRSGRTWRERGPENKSLRNHEALVVPDLSPSTRAASPRSRAAAVVARGREV